MSDCDCLEFPSFDALDNVDRPPPPSITDYPIGCEVELVDIDFAKTAQTPELWEPFMDTLFSQGRRSVRVVRHQGDYTFVVCENNPELIIGCTLYRACLSEPKVRFKKYIPSHSTETNVISMNCGLGGSIGSGGLLEAYGSGHREEMFDLTGISLARPAVTGGGSGNGASGGGGGGALPSCAPHVFNRRNVTNTTTTTTTAGGVLRRSRNPDHDPKTVARGTELAAPATTTTDNARGKYNYAMRKAYDALSEANYADAVRYYTKALKYCSDGGARCLSNRSVAYLGAHNLEAAFNDAMSVIDLTPNSYLGYVRAANTLRRMKRFEEARSYYEKALAIDPTSEVLNFLLLSNSVAMFYASKQNHRRVASVALDRETMRVILVAKKDMRPGELAWTDTTTLVTMLGNYKNVTVGGDDVSECEHSGAGGKVCQNCYRPLTKPQVFCDALPNIQPSLLCKLYSRHSPVQCNGHCGSFYCSDVCRSKAWAAHHWVECAVNGKWSEAFCKIPKLLQNFVNQYKDKTTEIKMRQQKEKREKSNVSVDNNCGVQFYKKSPSPALFACDDDVDITIACVTIACRMFARIISDGLPLEVAVHLYDWMSPTENDRNNNSASNDDTNPIDKVVIDELIAPVYALLEQCFTREEKSHLTFNIFLNCYQRVRFNCLKLRVSVWPTVQEKATTYIDVFRTRSCDASAESVQSFPLDCGSGGVGQVDMNLTHLNCIAKTSAELMPECFECIAVFKIVAATFCAPAVRSNKNNYKNSKNKNDEIRNNYDDDDEQIAVYNVKVRSSVEVGAVVHVDVIKNISKGEKLVTGDRLLAI